MTDDGPAERVAARIADGTWTPDPGRPSEDGLTRELDILAGIAAFHRGVCRPPASATWNALELRALIGEGSFGEVYRAWDPALERDVALKLLKDDATGGSGTADLIAEARRLARVRHPNVATVYGADVARGRAGVWMEWLDGHSLDALVEASGPIDPARAVEIGVALCSALEAVHDAGLVHGDVKPSNVIITTAGRIVLADFGAACDVSRRRRHAAFASPAFSAPELLAGAAIGPAHDLFSVGALLDRLLRGTRAAPSGTRPVASRRVPAQLEAVVNRATSRAPGSRFQTAGALALALRASLDRQAPLSRRYIAAIAACAALTIGANVALREATHAHSPVGHPAAVSPAARDAYLRGEFELRKRTREGLLRARDEFERAAALAPELAAAHAGVADAYLLLGVFGAVPLNDASARAEAAARQALALDGSLPAAHTALGYVLVLKGRMSEGIEEYRRAIDLDPRYATARQWYALTIVEQQPEEAIAQILAALALDPFSRAISTDVATVYVRAGQIDRAIEHFERTVRLFPSFPEVHIQLGCALAAHGDLAAAASRLGFAASRFPSNVSALVELGTVYAALGRSADARATLARLDALSRTQHVNPAMFALLYASLGQRMEALASAERALAESGTWNSSSLHHRGMARFRDDPEFIELARRGDRLLQQHADQ